MTADAMAAVPETRRRGGRWWTLVPVETRMLMRRRTTLLGLLFGPAIMIFLGVLLAPSTPQAWGALAGTAGLLGMLISVYLTAATVFTLRRESGALSRLRTTELTGTAIVAGTGTPLLLAGVTQAVLTYGVYLAVGAPVPADPMLLVVALVLGGAFCVVAGAFTATVSRSAEGVQYTALPLTLAAAAAANLLMNGVGGDTLRGLLQMVPGVPMADLVARAWAGEGPAPDVAGVSAAAVGIGLLLVWTAVAALASAARWRWTPRG